MTFSQLELFVTAAKFLSFSKAAEHLYITPSALSKSIHLLESELEVPLFDRQYHKLALTGYGAILFEHGKTVVDAFHQVRHIGSLLHTNTRGEISILGSGPWSSSFAGVYNAFTEKYPNIHWVNRSVSRGNQKDIVREVLAGSCDFGITYREYFRNESEKLDCFTLAHDHVSILISRQHPLAQRDFVQCSELAEFPFLWANHMIDYVREDITAHLSAIQAPPIRFIETLSDSSPFSSSDTLLSIQFGQVAIFAPSLIARTTIECKTIDISDYDLPLELVLFWNKENTNKASEAFIHFLQNTPFGIE